MLEHENTGQAELRMISRLSPSIVSLSAVNPRIVTCAIRIKQDLWPFVFCEIEPILSGGV